MVLIPVGWGLTKKKGLYSLVSYTRRAASGEQAREEAHRSCALPSNLISCQKRDSHQPFQSGEMVSLVGKIWF